MILAWISRERASLTTIPLNHARSRRYAKACVRHMFETLTFWNCFGANERAPGPGLTPAGRHEAAYEMSIKLAGDEILIRHNALV